MSTGQTKASRPVEGTVMPFREWLRTKIDYHADFAAPYDRADTTTQWAMQKTQMLPWRAKCMQLELMDVLRELDSRLTEEQLKVDPRDFVPKTSEA